jgi:hypothetical protein
MKNTIKMKAILRMAGIITLITVIGFSMAACGEGPGGGSVVLPAPLGLDATAISSSEIILEWNGVPGAVEYKVYISTESPSSGFYFKQSFDRLGTSEIVLHNGLQSSTTVHYKVSAVAADGTEGALSYAVSATTFSSGTSALSHSLDGIWWASNGEKITVSGSTGIVDIFGDLNPLGTDAVSKGYYNLGDQKWRNLTSTGNLTWSGQTRHIQYNTSSPHVATGTVWRDCTIIMSADGQTITFKATDSSGPYSFTYTRVQPVTTIVYIAGSYEIGGNNVYKPCYWVNGVRADLDVPAGKSGSATGIAVSGNNVYVSGQYETDTATSVACYWVNGTKYDLSLPAGITYSQTREIVVQGTTVYIAGQYRSGSNNSTRKACYWVNGTRTDIIAPNSRNSDSIGIGVDETTVYLLGVHGPTNDVLSFSFDMNDGTGSNAGIALVLPSGSGDDNYYDTPGTMMGTSIYIPGNVKISNIQRACYWRNGYRTDLSVLSGTTYSTAVSITAAGDSVYVAGRLENGDNHTACYWKDGTRTDLPVAGAAVTRAGDIAVLGTSVYVSGSYGSSAENRQACYWVNGSKTDLSVPAGTSFSNAATITVVDR